MKKLKETKEDLLLTKLLSFDQIKAKKFYEILDNGNRKLLNPKNVKIDEVLLEIRWNDILEKYYKLTNLIGFRSFLRELKRLYIMKNEMAAVEGAFSLYAAGFQIGAILKRLGIDGNVIQKVSQKRTKYLLQKAKIEGKNKQVAKTDYYKLLANASRKVGRNLDGEMLLIEWVGILNDIREENVKQNRETGNNKRGRVKSF